MNMMDIDMNENFMDIIYGKQQPQNGQQSIETAENGQDQYGFPFEPIDTYSTEPLGFIETARMLNAEAKETFDVLRVLNRHSPMFNKISAQFEKMLIQLGRVCITKAVIEQRKENTYEFDAHLRDITITRLREMAALNLRKCFDAFMEDREINRYNQDAFALSIRWAALDKRLQATADKIEQIKSGKIKVDLDGKKEPAARPSAENQKDLTQETSAERETERSLSDHVHALPVDKGALRESESVNAEPVSGAPECGPEEPSSLSQARELLSSALEETPTATEPEAEQTEPGEDDPEIPADEIGDAYEKEEYFPVVSEEMVRRMSELMQYREPYRWPFPRYEYADP